MDTDSEGTSLFLPRMATYPQYLPSDTNFPIHRVLEHLSLRPNSDHHGSKPSHCRLYYHWISPPSSPSLDLGRLLANHHWLRDPIFLPFSSLQRALIMPVPTIALRIFPAFDG